MEYTGNILNLIERELSFDWNIKVSEENRRIFGYYKLFSGQILNKCSFIRYFI